MYIIQGHKLFSKAKDLVEYIFICNSQHKSNFSSKSANKPRNTEEPHLFNLQNCKKVRFFQCHYSQNFTKGTESKVIQVSQMPGIE